MRKLLYVIQNEIIVLILLYFYELKVKYVTYLGRFKIAIVDENSYDSNFITVETHKNTKLMHTV